MSPLLSIYRRYAQNPWLGLCLLLIAQLAATGSPLVFGQLVTGLGEKAEPSWVWAMVALMCTLDSLHIICQYGFNCAIIRKTAALAKRLKDETVRRFLRLDEERRESSSSGEWERRICADTHIVAQSVCPAMGEIASTLISFCLVSLVMVCRQPVFLLLVLALALCFFGIYHLNKRKLQNSSRNARTTNYKEGTTLMDFLALTPIMGLFRATQNLLKRFSNVTQQMESHGSEAEHSATTYTMQIRGTMVLGITACLILSMLMFRQGKLEVGEIVAYMMLVGQISGQMGQLVFVVPTLARGAESAQALEEAFGLVSGKQISPEPTPPPVQQQANNALLCMRDVSFSYRNGNEVLRRLNWEVQRGEYHSILGSNGEGKSTLIRIILGTLQGENGCILRNFTRPGYVPQTTAIFSGSLRDNITLCHQDVDEKELTRILQLCRLEQLVERLGDVQTSVSREQLSGGEIQRIGIARALLIQPDLLVVDEITNNLDIVNKSIIYSTLRELKGRCTIISISHDMEALADSDFCWILHRGTLHPIPPSSAEEKRAFAFHMIETNRHAE